MSFFSAARRVMDLSLGEMLWSRRTIFMALVVGGPVILAVIVRILETFGMPALRVNGQRVAGMGVFGVMIWMLFLRFIVPVLGVFYGTALMADEVEDKTITYLFTRPIPRGAVLVGKYLAYVVCTSLVVLPSVMLVYFMLVRLPEVPGRSGSSSPTWDCLDWAWRSTAPSSRSSGPSSNGLSSSAWSSRSASNRWPWRCRAI